MRFPTSRLRRFLALSSAAVLGLFVNPAQAHPIHASYAEADYRDKSGRLEIALRLFTDDIEAALSKRSGKKIVVGKTPAAEFNDLLLSYLRSAFTLKSREGAPQVLNWVGRELKEADQHLWVYLDCPLPTGIDGARILNGVLRESFPDQLNSVRVRAYLSERAAAAATPQVTLIFLENTEQVVAFPR